MISEPKIPLPGLKPGTTLVPPALFDVAFYECVWRDGELVALHLLMKDNTVKVLEGEALTDTVRRFVAPEEDDDTSALPL